MFEEKNNHETTNDDTAIDPTFLAQVNKKCAHYRAAAIAEKAKKEEALLEFDAVAVQQAKDEHNEQTFPAVTSVDSTTVPITVFNTVIEN